MSRLAVKKRKEKGKREKDRKGEAVGREGKKAVRLY